MSDDGIEVTVAEGGITEAVIPLRQLHADDWVQLKRFLMGGEDQIGANVD